MDPPHYLVVRCQCQQLMDPNLKGMKNIWTLMENPKRNKQKRNIKPNYLWVFKNHVCLPNGNLKIFCFPTSKLAEKPCKQKKQYFWFVTAAYIKWYFFNKSCLSMRSVGLPPELCTFGFAHLLALLISHQAMQVNLLEGSLVGQSKAHHHHASHPKEQDVLAMTAQQPWVVPLFMVFPNFKFWGMVNKQSWILTTTIFLLRKYIPKTWVDFKHPM